MTPSVVPALPALSGSDTPPLDPSSEQAREWLEQELSRGYQAEPGLWERFTEWLRDLLTPDSPVGGGLAGWVLPVVLVVIAVVIALVVARVVRPEARARRTSGTSDVLDDPSLTAADYRARARASLSRNDLDDALLDGFRAIAARAVERTLLGDLPGRTAHEIAVALTTAFPDHAAALTATAAAFDDVRYGDRSATRASAESVLALDTTLERVRPTLPGLPFRAGATT